MTELERCEAEQRQLRADADAGKCKAWLVVLGLEDWEREKRLIEEEARA